MTRIRSLFAPLFLFALTGLGLGVSLVGKVLG